MSDEAKARLEVVALIFSIILASAAAVKAWALLPYRLDRVEEASMQTSIDVHSIERDQAKLSGDIRESLAEIRAAQGQFRQDIAEIKADVKALRK